MTQKIALCIGINDYPGTDSDLRGCVNDAKDWAKALGSRGFGVTYLLDGDATGERIRKGLRDCAEMAEDGDLVVITYSGHGTFILDEDGDEPDGMDECWCPSDIATNGPITDDELNALFSSRRSGVRWVVLSDSCHSGTVSRFGRSTDASDGAGSPRARFLPPGVFSASALAGHRAGLADVRFIASAPGRGSALLMSGCQDSEYSWDASFNGRSNGAFTYQALRALKALGEDASYTDWHKLIRERLPEARFPQSPGLYGAASMGRWAVFQTAAEDGGQAEWTGAAWGSGDAAGELDPVSVGRALADDVLAHRSQARSRGAKDRIARGGGDAEERTLLAEGDSWLAFPLTNVISCLEDRHGFEVFSDATNGDLIEDMAYSGGYLDKFLRTIQRLKRNGIRKPSAIILSGGGNDVIGRPFAELLNHAGSARPGLNARVVEGIIHERLRDAYVTMLSALAHLCEREYGHKIKVLVHGYDYAVPDGRGFRGWWIPVAGPWMSPGFERKGYKALRENKEIVARLIDELNAMLAELASQPGMEHVKHIDLRKRLPNGSEYKRWWVDELHPTRRGFEAVAAEFARMI